MSSSVRLALASAFLCAATHGARAQEEPGDPDEDDDQREAARRNATASTETGIEVPVDVIERAAPPSLLPPPTDHDLGRRIGAVPRTTPVRIDGRLDDSAWAAAPAQTGFYQREPHPGQPPRLRTEFKVLYDRDAIYVAVRAFDDQPEKIVRFLTRRDVFNRSDWVGIGIDSYADRRTAFHFGVNAAGGKIDLLHFNDSEADWSWDAVWDAGAEVDEQGWTAEFRIPFRSTGWSVGPVR